MLFEILSQRNDHDDFLLFALGADPKSIFCAFYKQGLCKKGNKCKFSHDPAVEGKVAKRNFYEKTEENEGDEGMEGWDQTTLNEVINKKHGAEKSNTTTIVSTNSFVGILFTRFVHLRTG